MRWFRQLKLRYIWYPRWHGMCLANTFWDLFYFLAGLGGVWATQVEVHFVFSLTLICLVNRSWDIFCFRWHRRFLFNTSLFCFRWHGMGLVNTCWDTFFHCWHGWVWSTHAELHFLLSLAWGRGWLAKICWNTFCVLAS